MDMEYLYCFANASLILRIFEYLQNKPQLPVGFLTVIHQIDGWVVKFKMNFSLNAQQDGDFQAFLNELGTSYKPPVDINIALWRLDVGQTPLDVMLYHHLVLVSYGSPKRQEVEAFRQKVIEGLGYCPKTLA